MTNSYQPSAISHQLSADLTTLDTAQGFAFAVKGDLEDFNGV